MPTSLIPVSVKSNPIFMSFFRFERVFIIRGIMASPNLIEAKLNVISVNEEVLET